MASVGLLAVADVAAARYHQPLLRASLDPVVTGNGDRLRFESFSGCGGVYARLDVLAPGLDGGEVGQGTTGTVTAEDGPVHRVRDQAGVLSCSCLWWARYRGGRGPCKHALAVRTVRRGAADGQPG